MNLTQYNWMLDKINKTINGLMLIDIVVEIE